MAVSEAAAGAILPDGAAAGGLHTNQLASVHCVLLAGLCILQGGAAGDIRAQCAHAAACRHCCSQSNGGRPTGRAKIRRARPLRGEGVEIVCAFVFDVYAGCLLCL